MRHGDLIVVKQRSLIVLATDVFESVCLRNASVGIVLSTPNDSYQVMCMFVVNGETYVGWAWTDDARTMSH